MAELTPATPAPGPAPRRGWLRRHWMGGALSALVLLGGLAWGIKLLLGVQVHVVHLARRAVVETVVASGRVLAPARVNLGLQIGGAVRRVAAREGERVSAGQLLVELDDKELRATLAQAQAGRLNASAGVAKIEGVGGELAREELRQATLAVSQAIEEQARQRKLSAAGAGIRKNLLDADNALSLAESQRRAALARLEDASPQGAERRRVGAQRDEAEASLRLAQARLTQTRLVAPSDGILLERHVEAGDVIPAGKVLFVFAPAGETRVVVQLDEKELGRIALEQHAMVSAEAAPDRSFDAQLSYIAPSIDPQRATVEVRLRVPAPPPFLLPDMTVSVDIRVGQKADAMVLPLEAVRDAAGDDPWVLVADGGRARRVPVKLGLRGADFAEIIAGVGPEAAVIPEGERRAKPGSRVRIGPAR